MALGLLLALASGGLWAASQQEDPLFESFTRRDGSKYLGVYLRDQDNGVVVALPQGTELKERVDARRGARTCEEVSNLSQSLNSIEGWVQKSRLIQAQAELPRLREALAAFEKLVEPKLQSSANSDEFKACLQHALAYYRQQTAGVEPTLQAVELTQKLRAFEQEIASGHRAPSRELLLQIATALHTIMGLENLMPWTARDRARAVAELERRVGAVSDALRAAAVTRFRNEGSASDAQGLLDSLREGAALHPAFVPAQDKLIGALIEVTGALAAKLPGLALGSFRFDGEVREDVGEYRQQLRLLSVQTAGLTEIAKGVFGERAAALAQTLATQVAQNGEVSTKAEATRAELAALREEFGAAGAATAAGEYGRAVERYAALDAHVARTPLANSEFRLALARLRLKAQALDLRQRLRATAAATPAAYQALREEAERFLTKNRNSLPVLGVRAEDYDSKLEEIKGYLEFSRRLEQVTKDAATEPRLTWIRLLDLSAEVAQPSGPILPRAREDWAAYLARHEKEVFARASALVPDRGLNWADARDQRAFLGLLEYLLRQEKDGAVRPLAEAALEQIQRPATDAFVGQILELELRAARRLTSRDPNAALAGYLAIQKRFPAFAAGGNVESRIVELLLTQADGLAPEDVAGKVALYERICREYPARVDTQLLDRLLNAKRRLAPELASDPKAWLQTLEGYAGTFPGLLRDTEALKAFQAAQVTRYAEQWDRDAHNLNAAEEFCALATAFPNVVRDSELPDRVLGLTRKRLNNIYQGLTQELAQSAPGAPPLTPEAAAAQRRVVVGERVISGVERLRQPAFSKQRDRYNFDDLTVVLRLHQADSYLRLQQVGSVAKAFAIFAQLERDYPELARTYHIAERQRAWEWRRRLERIRLPLGLHDHWDLGALGFWVLFWLVYSLRALRHGRRHGYLRYSLWHLATVLAFFLLLLAVLLVGSHGALHHLSATALALLIPGAICHGLGFFSYSFFPLIYARRRLLLGQALWRVASLVPGVGARLTGWRTRLQHLEEDVPLLHDRWLFHIAQAIRLAEHDVPAAHAAFGKLLASLDREVVKGEAWREHHKTCLFNLGQLAWRLRRFQEAEACLNGHLELEPRSCETHELLADLQFERQAYEKAIPHFKVCLATDSKNDRRWFQLGRCFFELGKYPAACKCFEAIQQPDRDALLHGARTYARAGLQQKAIEWYERLLRDNATDGEAIFHLASAFAQLNEDVKALKIITLVPPEHPFYPQALALQGGICLRNRKLDKAGEFYRSALEYTDDLEPALLGLAQLALDNGDVEAAAGHLERLLRDSPEHAAANYYYGLVLEARDPELAVPHFSRALAAPQFRRLASNHLGRLYFFRGDYPNAIQYFEAAATAGELSPWFLFLHAYALAAERQLPRCHQVLIRILGHTTPDPDWQARSVQALYTIGYQLFTQADYRMATQCFEYVREHLREPELRAPLEALLEEARFRQVVGLLGQGDYVGATGLVSELQLSTTNPDRAVTYQFYLALCQLHVGELAPARDLLATLTAQARAAGPPPAYPRYAYHLAAAEIGLGNAAAATPLLDELAATTPLPPQIAMGLQTLRAFLLARAGQLREAEQRLAETRPPAPDYQGAAFVRQRFFRIRAYYLCRIQDSARFQFLVREMDEATQAQAVYLQALSCLEGGHVAAAVHNLQPFADRSDENRQLFTLLAAELASRALAERQDKRALEALTAVPAPPPEIGAVVQALQTANQLQIPGDLAQVRALSEQLAPQLAAVTDPVLQHQLIHNQAILMLRQALLVEETREKEAVEECWQNFWAFWEPYVFQNKEYWSRSLERLSAPGAALRPFTDKEIEGLNLAFRDEVLARLFIGHILTYLCQPGGQTDLGRHLNYLANLGRADQKLAAYLQTLGEQAQDFVAGIEKGDPILKTWDFVIGYMRIQVAVAETVRPDDLPPLQAQLETYLEFRNHYAAPTDFLQAKRVFNTALLETVQMGINGKFSAAGDRLEAVLGDLPHGVNLGPLEEALWKLREVCRKPGAAEDRGINLVQEFERVYQRVVSFALQKGS